MDIAEWWLIYDKQYKIDKTHNSGFLFSTE